VLIGEGAYIGAGAIILQGVSIGREALVGAGVVVTEDVADGAILRPSSTTRRVGDPASTNDGDSPLAREVGRGGLGG
jgi:serine acetyltransferase